MMDPEKSAHMASGSSLSQGQMSRRTRVAAAPFAGRVGGNQEFIASDDSSILERQPDAAPLQSVSEAFNLKSFADHDLWRMALLEGWGTMLLTFVLGGAAIGLTAAGQSPFATTLYASLANFLALSIFILCLGPVSGGHLNPSITLATFFAGLSTFPRAVLYITAQSTGAIVAAYLLKLGVGSSNYFTAGIIPACTVDPQLVSVGQMFVLEFVFGLAAIFMAFGVGLDPRQANTYGSALAPILVGVTLALGTLGSAIIRPGYTGASLNPARCLGLMTARYELQNHWVHWVGQLAATSVHGLLYHIAPPWSKDDSLLERAIGHMQAGFHPRSRRSQPPAVDRDA